jgi:Domain of unknown function (DUF4265)
MLGGTVMSETLTKVHIDLPNHFATGGEAMWAAQVGSDEYELRNVPFHAYDLNYLDVVEAVSRSPDLKPSVLRVIRRSGHRTLRVSFVAATPIPRRVPLLESLKGLGASFEGATKSLFAIDVEPDGDYQAVYDRLQVWQDEGLVDFETCEARVEGSFDDAPGEGESSGAA